MHGLFSLGLLAGTGLAQQAESDLLSGSPKPGVGGNVNKPIVTAQWEGAEVCSRVGVVEKAT